MTVIKMQQYRNRRRGEKGERRNSRGMRDLRTEEEKEEGKEEEDEVDPILYLPRTNNPGKAQQCMLADRVKETTEDSLLSKGLMSVVMNLLTVVYGVGADTLCLGLNTQILRQVREFHC